jgi:hypothetical protein
MTYNPHPNTPTLVCVAILGHGLVVMGIKKAGGI